MDAVDIFIEVLMFWFVAGCLTLGGVLFALGFVAGRREAKHWEFTTQLMRAYIDLKRERVDESAPTVELKPYGVD